MPRILLIEDDVPVRKLFSHFLKISGYEVIEAADGIEGTELYHSTPADLVITDFAMPRKNGLEIIAELRRDFPVTKFLLISGWLEVVPEDLPFLAKPFPPETLLRAVKELLNDSLDPSI